MRTRLLAILNATILTLTLPVVLAPSQGMAFAQDAAAEQATEDVIHMSDGRVLHGKILNETRSLVVFEYVDPNVKLKTKLTLLKDNIAQIDRNVAVSADAKQETPKESKPVSTGGVRTSTTSARTYGTSRVTTNDAEVPSIYVVSMKGQLGTDIRSELYKSIVSEIREQKPSLVVLEVNCSDTSEMMFPEGHETPRVPPEIAEDMRRREWGMLDLENYREIVHMFRDGLRDIPQVVWVHDSDGLSAVVFMAWDKIYMSPNARLGSKVSFLAKTGATSWQDSDVRAKMIAAWMGIAKGFLEKGGYSLALAQAMLEPTAVLSCDWKGRFVNWRLDDGGAYTVDTSDKHTTYFQAKTAEDFCLSQGTAEDVNDLALLLGYREYRLLESKHVAQLDQYVQDWRRAFADTLKWYRDYQQHRQWASGNETLKWLGRAKADIERIIAAMNRYKAVELRWEQDYGIPKMYLEILVEQMKEQIQGIKRGGAARGGGGVGGGGGGQAAE